MGIYLPYWSFDNDADCDYFAEGGIDRTEEYEEDGKRAHIYFLNESKWAEFLENEKLLDSFVSEIHRKFIHFSIYDFLNAYRGNNCQPESLKGLMKKLVDSGVLLKPETADVPYSKNPLKKSAHKLRFRKNTHLYTL